MMLVVQASWVWEKVVFHHSNSIPDVTFLNNLIWLNADYAGKVTLKLNLIQM